MFEESDELHRRARAFVRAFEDGTAPEPFDGLACDLARFQGANVEGYARLCRARGVSLSSITRAGDAPAVPTDAFKLARVATFPEPDARVSFRTSGTTIGARGMHAMRDVGTYDAAALAFGRAALVHDLRARPPVLVLGLSPEDAPDSSLGHMLDLFARELGAPATRAETYFVDPQGVIDLEAFDRRVARALLEDAPSLVLGTSFAFVHFLEALGDDTFRLPRGSRVMQTGGYKGKSREVPAAELRRDLARVFHIPEAAIVAEYGMTELSSQFYEWTLRDSGARHGVYREPPWARVVPVDPETLAALPEGEVGIARIEDLMNVDSAFAVLASDRVRRVGDGFELLGRAAGAPPRGCSIALDEILGR
ncbi:MAG: acyl-protein synthetase [Polyangiaceae bacterium]